MSGTATGGGWGANRDAEVVSAQSHGGAKHTYTIEERRSFAEHINQVLKDDPHLKDILPVNPQTEALFAAVSDGVLLCKLINKVKPGTIPENKIMTAKGKNPFQITANHNLALQGAKDIGCQIVSIDANHLTNKVPHLILGILWQIIRIDLLSKVTLQAHPEMVALLGENESIKSFAFLPPEQNLLRWFNYHLKRANYPKQVTNFSGDIKDSEAYTVLLNQLKPQLCNTAALQERDPLKRAGMVLQNAEKLGCRKFVDENDIVNGNAKLNLAFVAYLFNQHPGLEVKEQEDEEARKRRDLEVQEALRLKAKAEEDARRAFEEADRARRESEEKRTAWEREEESRKKKWAEEEESRKRQWQIEEEQRRKAWQDDEVRRKQAADDHARSAINQAEQLRLEEEARRRKWAEEEAARKKHWEEQEQLRLKAEYEAEQRRRQEEERRRQEEDRRRQEEQRKKEEEERRRQEEERRWDEEARKRAEDKRRRHEEEARKKAEEDKARYDAEQQAASQWAQYQQQQQLNAAAQQNWQQEQQRQQEQAAAASYYQQQQAASYYQQQQQQSYYQDPNAAYYQQGQSYYQPGSSYYVPPTAYVVQPQATSYVVTTAHTSRIYVSVMEGRNLVKKDLFGLGKSDPYCIVESKGKRYQTIYQKNTQFPVWGDTFEFPPMAAGDEINVSVWDYDKVSRHDFMGEVKLRDADFVSHQKWYELKPRVGQKDRVAGELLIKIVVA